MTSNLSRRDRMLLAVAGVVVMYAIAGVLWFTSQEMAWRTAAKKYAAAEKKTLSEKRLISQRQKWNDAYEEEREQMPMFAEGALDVDTHWLRRMNALALENNVSISQSQAGKQVEAGDVKEQPIDVKRWEATITSLVEFIHALESATNAMFDVREISIKPSARKGGGFLTGSFKLACAYMHGDVEEKESEEEKEEPKAAKKASGKDDSEKSEDDSEKSEDDSEDKTDEKAEKDN